MARMTEKKRREYQKTMEHYRELEAADEERRNPKHKMPTVREFYAHMPNKKEYRNKKYSKEEMSQAHEHMRKHMR